MVPVYFAIISVHPADTQVCFDLYHETVKKYWCELANLTVIDYTIDENWRIERSEY